MQATNNARNAMKVRLIEVEGTAEEIRDLPELRELFGVSAPDAEPFGEEAADGEAASGLPKQVSDFIKVRAGNRDRADVTSRWVEEVLGWGNTEAEPGRSKASGDGMTPYLMLHPTGPR